jgi:organic radical activating enzyme
MSAIIKIDSNKPHEVLRIELFLSNLCNYKCWYCFPGSNEGTHRWPKLENIKDNLSYLLDYYKVHLNKSKFHLHVIGGEPTLWSDFDKFIKHFKEEYNCFITTSTNGSRTIRWWEEHGQNFDEVMISCHHEFVNIDHVSEVAKILYKKNVWVTASVLMDPTVWDKCKNIVDELKRKSTGWPVVVSEIYHDTVNYNDGQKKYLSTSVKKIPNLWYFFKNKKVDHQKPKIYYETGETRTVDVNWLSLNKLNNFYGWTCNLGMDTIYINKDGFISGACGENLYNLKYKFNIFETNFKEQFSPNLIPTTCYKKQCSCQPEMNCRKEKTVISLETPLLAEYPLNKYTSL